MGISYSNNIGLIVKFKSFFRWKKILCLCFIKTIYIIFWMKKTLCYSYKTEIKSRCRFFINKGVIYKEIPKDDKYVEDIYKISRRTIRAPLKTVKY